MRYLLKFVLGDSIFRVDRLGWDFRFATSRRFASDCCSFVTLRECCCCSRRGTCCSCIPAAADRFADPPRITGALAPSRLAGSSTPANGWVGLLRSARRKRGVCRREGWRSSGLVMWVLGFWARRHIVTRRSSSARRLEHRAATPSPHAAEVFDRAEAGFGTLANQHGGTGPINWRWGDENVASSGAKGGVVAGRRGPCRFVVAGGGCRRVRVVGYRLGGLGGCGVAHPVVFGGGVHGDVFLFGRSDDVDGPDGGERGHVHGRWGRWRWLPRWRGW